MNQWTNRRRACCLNTSCDLRMLGSESFRVVVHHYCGKLVPFAISKNKLFNQVACGIEWNSYRGFCTTRCII